MDYHELSVELERMTDEPYRQFAAKLLPPDTALLGIRFPQLHALARKICRETDDVSHWLSHAPAFYLEERLLQGFVIASAKMDFSLRLEAIRQFLPKINNWSVCDSFCCSLKCAKKHPEEVWCFLDECLSSTNPYTLRFAIVMILDHFASPAYIPLALQRFEQLPQQQYYVQMAIAWAISVFFIKAPELIKPYLLQSRLDNITFNKALQKCQESRRISAKDKASLRLLKR